MVLFIIGLGLSDEKDITVRGLEAVKSCKRLYLEFYTSVLGMENWGREKLEAFYGVRGWIVVLWSIYSSQYIYTIDLIHVSLLSGSLQSLDHALSYYFQLSTTFAQIHTSMIPINAILPISTISYLILPNHHQHQHQHRHRQKQVPVVLADRTMVESEADQIYGEAKDENIGFLVVGDPLCT